MRMTYAQFDRALRIVESDNDPAAYGDGGQALGALQQHPAFVQRWAGHLLWHTGWTWDDVFDSALFTFYNAANAGQVDDVTAAVGYHRHGAPWANAGDFEADDYADRFRKAMEAVLAAAPAVAIGGDGP